MSEKIVFKEVTLPEEWIWDNQPTGERLKLLLQHYNMWLEIQYVGEKIHNLDEYYMCNPNTWDMSPCDPQMSLEDIKGWLPTHVLQEAREDLLRVRAATAQRVARNALDASVRAVQSIERSVAAIHTADRSK